jgi:uncharacterized membrane protein YjjP (DUF1212 family)
MTDVRAASSPDPGLSLLVRLGRALHEAGFPSPLLEGSLARVAERLGITASFFTTPTSIFSAFGEEAEQRVHLERVEPASVDLGRLADLDALVGRVLGGELAPADAAAEIHRVAAAPPRYGAATTLAAFAIASATGGVFLGGGAEEVAAGGVIGVLTGLLALALGRYESVSRVFEPIAAAVAAGSAVALARLLPGLSVYLATLAGLIILLPGFTLTVALSELATRHLSSGTARLAGALAVFVSIAFGVAVGTRVGTLLFGDVAAAVPAPLPAWVEPLALLVAPIAIAVLLKAPLGEAPWILVGGVIGFEAGRFGSALFSPELGMFFGALAVGVFSRFYARWRDRPEQIPLVPGILLLVPGSIGYRSLASLMARDVVLGVESAFRMIVIAVSLVAGLLAAAALGPSRPRWAPPPVSSREL